MKGLWTIGLLIVSNVFMTFAWYGQLRLKGQKWFDELPLAGIVIMCWSIALLEYFFLVPANRIGFHGNDGPFSLMQLFTLVFFKTEALRWNHAVAFILLVLAVYFIFKK